MGAKTECPACLEVFNGEKAFLKHKVGDYPERRCLTVPEMQMKGYVRGRYGHWNTPTTPPSSPRTA